MPRIDYGLTPVGPTDLAHLMMIEYASSYGNDWFVVPLTLPVGSLTRIDSLVVTDSFGVRTLLRPIGDRALPRPNWSMWQIGAIAAAPARNRATTGVEPVLPAADARPRTGRRAARGCAVHARRDGQPRLGDRTHRSRVRSSSRSLGSSAMRTQPPMRPPINRRRRRPTTCFPRASRATGYRCFRCRRVVRTARSSRGFAAAPCCSPTDRSASIVRKAMRSPLRASCCSSTRRCRARDST